MAKHGPSPNEPPKGATQEEIDEWFKVPRGFMYKGMKKRGKKSILETDPNFLHRVSACAGFHMSKKEACAILRISRQHFDVMLAEHEEVRDAWELGRGTGKASLRMLLWRMAQDDPATARFLAKQRGYLNMDDGATKAAKVSAEEATANRISREEALARVEELINKLSLAKDGKLGHVIEGKALPSPRR